jgi:hypothetical protein
MIDNGINKVSRITSNKIQGVDKRTPLLKILQLKGVKKELEDDKNNIDRLKGIQRILFRARQIQRREETSRIVNITNSSCRLMITQKPGLLIIWVK